MIPQDFIHRIKQQFPTEWEEFLSSLNQNPISSIRYNPKKSKTNYTTNIPWTSHGVYLNERPKFTLDPLFHAGSYYVQESSSMFIDYVLGYLKSKISLDKVLDLCAAPGGKSTIILDHLESHQYLISNEILPKRNLILRENLTKWGYPNFIITENSPKEYSSLPEFFDAILLDAPCSGEGLFRKDKASMDEWSLENAQMCSERQYDIFKSIWSSLKVGGYLIYSTCTYNPDENERLLSSLNRSGYEFECEQLEIDKGWEIDTIEFEEIIGYRFLPHKVKGEGFFCSILRKKGIWEKSKTKSSKSYINPWVYEFIDQRNLEGYSTYKFKNSLYLSPNSLLDDLDILQKMLYVKQIGIEVGNYNGAKIEINHGLSQLFFAKIYPQTLKIESTDAINYLAKESISFKLEDGYTELFYNEISIGFILSEGSKIVNLYPSAWKIRSK